MCWLLPKPGGPEIVRLSPTIMLIVIAALTTSFLTGIENDPAVPAQVAATANVQLAGGVPFISDSDLEQALSSAGVSADVTRGVVEANTQARVAGLRSQSPCSD